jgi:hypothetical protein
VLTRAEAIISRLTDARVRAFNACFPLDAQVVDARLRRLVGNCERVVMGARPRALGGGGRGCSSAAPTATSAHELCAFIHYIVEARVLLFVAVCGSK